ncbi:MAG: serine/threonine-protein kinase [Myxococcales bacterium]|nr:serine/threonine-protein kinase [Myxococcales bacterium]
MTTLNRSVKEHLKRLVRDERTRTTRVLVRLRAAGAGLYLLATLYFATVERLPDWQATLPFFATYTVLALFLWGVTVKWPQLLPSAGLAVGLLDLPAMTMVSLSAISSMEQPVFLLGSLMPALCAGIVMAAVALDRASIVLATVSALLSTVVLLNALHAPPSEFVAPAITIALVGVGCGYLVTRVRSLVEESRRKDFAGKYVLGDRIGAGGMAEVFTATYSPEGGFERKVAVKRVLPSHAQDEQFLALFRREAELGAALAHPNLVQVLDFGRHLDSWFLAMEFVDGVTLSALLRAYGQRGESVPLPACLFVISEVAEGLSYLHEKPSPDGRSVGLVHRDVNPPNVLLSRAGEVKISDFGVARWQASGGLTATGAVRGKLAYMAPEQLDGTNPLPAWDVFAFGVTAYELLTGRRLFSGDSDVAVMRALLEQPISAPSTLRPDVSPEVDALVLSLLERDPTKRLASAKQVSLQLRQLTGADAPYPHGQRALVDAIATVGPVSLAQAPVSSTPGAPRDGATVTVNPPTVR